MISLVDVLEFKELCDVDAVFLKHDILNIDQNSQFSDQEFFDSVVDQDV
jgi:hypothetical protein